MSYTTTTSQKNTLSCREAEELFLSSGAELTRRERKRLCRHLAFCPDCARKAAEWEKVRECLPDLQEEPPAEWHAALMQAVRAEKREQENVSAPAARTSRFAWARWLAVSACFVLCVGVFILAVPMRGANSVAPADGSTDGIYGNGEYDACISSDTPREKAKKENDDTTENGSLPAGTVFSFSLQESAVYDGEKKRAAEQTEGRCGQYAYYPENGGYTLIFPDGTVCVCSRTEDGTRLQGNTQNGKKISFRILQEKSDELTLEVLP